MFLGLTRTQWVGRWESKGNMCNMRVSTKRSDERNETRREKVADWCYWKRWIANTCNLLEDERAEYTVYGI